MKKLVNMLAGGRNATATGRAVVYSAFGTAIALILVMAILIVSSIAFAVIDATTPDLEEDMDGGDNEPVTNVAIEYTTLEDISALKAKVDSKLVKVADGRTKMAETNHFYYAKDDNDGIDQLSSTAMKALDKMLVDFYTKNKNLIKTDIKSAECNIPLIKNTDTAGTGFVIVDFNNNELSKNPALYKWITDNAYKYGFVHENGGFQYVGVGVAAYAKTVNAYKTFVSNVKAKTAGAEMGIGNGYKAYYVAADATEIKVPSNLSYEVFADGASGYIVVVKTST